MGAVQGRMTANTGAMKSAGEDIRTQKVAFSEGVAEINRLITTELVKNWQDSACDNFVQKFNTKSLPDLQDLEETLGRFSNEIIEDADQLEEVINGIRNKIIG